MLFESLASGDLGIKQSDDLFISGKFVLFISFNTGAKSKIRRIYCIVKAVKWNLYTNKLLLILDILKNVEIALVNLFVLVLCLT